MYRVFNPVLIKIVFKADTYEECMNYKVQEGFKDFQTASILRVIRPENKEFDKTFKNLNEEL